MAMTIDVALKEAMRTEGAIDRTRGNLALARHQMRIVAESIEI